MSRHTIVVLAFNQALPSGLIGIIDMLALANLSQEYTQKTQHESCVPPGALPEASWAPEVVSASMDGSEITDGQGRRFKPDCAISDISDCAGILIPGFVPDQRGLPPTNITNTQCQAWMRQQYERGAFLGGSCSGVFALGEASLLNKRRCTTTWWLHYELVRRFPLANVAWASPMIDDNRVLSAGGPLSWVDVSLRVIRSLAGNDIANRVADFAVVDTAPSMQNKYIPQGHLLSADPFLIEAEHKIRQKLNLPISMSSLASDMAVSERTLHRRLKQLTGESPKTFIDRVRMDVAKTLLQTGNKPIGAIAQDLGYSDDTVFRRLFRKQIGMTPSEFRLWIKSRSAV